MFSMKHTSKLALPVLSLCSALLFTSCDSKEDNPTPDADSSFVVSLAIQGSDGGFTYYTVPFRDVMSGSLSAKGKGIEQPGYFDFTQIDNTIYSIGGLDDVNVVGISKTETGELKQVGNVSFPNSLSDIVKADDSKLVALEMASTSDMVKFHTINSGTVSVSSTKQHRVSDITNLSAPSYSGMTISGNHLYLSYYISDPNTFATPHTDKAQIAVYSYPGLEFQKVIEDNRTGPIGGFNTKSGLIKDERGDVYALSHSNPANGYSQTTNKGGILRIKSGETIFDQSYFFDVEQVTGGKNIAHLKYLGNGKALAEVNSADNSQQARWSDGPLRTAIIDLNSKTVTYINGLPEHAGNGRRLAAVQDGKYVYMAIPEGDGIFVYRIDTETNTATKGAEVEANFVAGISKL
ncbi:DUF4374 domain-containing protein [Pontibacter virosus]|uniref:Uncharacterized protein DUF4374 n=1 Tax=Pontibacter virosus TaxID=1765052 RepID=A0A2U1B2H9_9BACT|nr:DUF4374 domain-containing protein [Pontibacter virosus]PVY42886.1 uncharacterized protein DUF4374 [Pontibacter virosus]